MATRIMVVDDEVLICQLLTYQLSGAGYEVTAVQSGQEALRRLIVEQPDLVLLDVMIGDMSGWDVCRHIRANSSVPIIMLTAKGADGDIVTGLGIGADDYITKPFSLPQLLARIEAVLRRAHLVQVGPSRQHSAAARLHTPAPRAASATAVPNTWPKPALFPLKTPVLPAAVPSRVELSEQAAAPAAEPPPDHPTRRSLGQRLEEARKLRGLTLHQAEHVCGVRWDFLQALEREHFEYMPRPQLRRALQAYSASLNLEVNDFLEQFERPFYRRWPVPVVVALVTVLLVVFLGLQFF